MIENHTLDTLAKTYQDQLPDRLRTYLNTRGITDAIIERHLLGWNGWRITIPIPNRAGFTASFKLAKDPDDTSDAAKMLASAGAPAELYGWEHVRAGLDELVICEGEFDRLVLESHGVAAVTSTAGALTFRPEWADALRTIPTLYVCFDRDEAGRAGVGHLARLLPRLRVVDLPEEVGEGGDVTDFFVRLAHTVDDFRRLLGQATAPPHSPPPERVPLPPAPHLSAQTDVAFLKAAIRLDALVERYLPLRRVGQTFVGRCPFHEDRRPSFTVYPQTQTFHCYGCRAHGDALTFLMKVEHLTFREAVNVLKRLAG